MRYLIRFSHGQEHAYEADRLDDDGVALSLWQGGELVIRIQDSDITVCEAEEWPQIAAGEPYGPKDGVKLYAGDGATIAAYRSAKAAHDPQEPA